MSKHNRHTARSGYQQQRQALRQALDEVPIDLIAAAPAAPTVVDERPESVDTGEKSKPRRGFLGLGRRGGDAKAQPAAAAAQPAAHPQTFEIERRAQRLDEALANAREDLTATTRELDEVHHRLAEVEAELATERAASQEWRDTAAQLDQHFDSLRAAHEQLQHEHAALATAFENEQSASRHWERVASEQMTALDDLGAQLGSAGAELQAERDTHEQTRAWAADLQGQLTALQAQWDQHAAELTAALEHEREEFHRTLEDERRTAEQAYAEQAFQHREQVEQFQREASAAIAALQQKVADTLALLEAANADLGASRADVVRLTEDVEAARGEALAATTRAREADDLRLRAEQRVEELGEELAYVRSEVMGSDAGRKKAKGLFGRGKPAPVKAAEKQTRAAVSLNDVAAPPVDPDVEDIIERRLFGSA
jgi:myosin heavy subunit